MSVTVVGLDGRPPAPAAQQALDAATLVVGGRRHLEALPLPACARTVVLGDLAAGLAALGEHVRSGRGPAVVLASGDPGFFGVVRRLRAEGFAPDVHPGASSVALLSARAGVPWDTVEVVSAHGRDPRPALAVVRSGRPVAVLTDAVTGPAEVAACLPAQARVVVGERLGAADERVSDTTARHVAGATWAQPNVVLVPGDDDGGAPAWRAGAVLADGWALAEESFEHRDGLVTKAEVRAWALARLAPAPGRLVWDVGAGSGSVAVECARLGAAAVAVERDPAQCDRVRANAARHGVRVDGVDGAAPQALSGLPEPDAVFVGGGGADVLAAVADLRPPRVVVALAALDRVAGTVDVLRRNGFDVSGVQLAASRLADLPGGGLRLAAANPVTVVSGVLP